MPNYIVRPSAYLSGTSSLATNAVSNADMTTKLSDNSDATTVIHNTNSALTTRFTLGAPTIPSDEFIARAGGSIRWKDGGGAGSGQVWVGCIPYRSIDTAPAITPSTFTDGRSTFLTSEVSTQLVTWSNTDAAALRLQWYDGKSSSTMPTVTTADLWATLYTLKRATATPTTTTITSSVYPTIPVAVVATIDWEASASDASKLRRVTAEVRIESGGSGAGTGTLVATQNVDLDFVATGTQNISVVFTAPVPNGTYNVYARGVRYRDNQTTYLSDQVSAWASATLTMNVTGPTTPAVTDAAWDETTQRVAIEVSANMIPNPDFETNTTGWIAGSNSTIARSTTTFFAGVASLAITSVAAGSINANTSTGTSGILVTPGQQYTASAWFRAATVGRNGRIDVQWYDAAGANISTTSGTNQAFTTTAWTRITGTHTAPALAAFARPIFSVVGTGAAGEVHNIDNAQFEFSPVATTYRASGVFATGSQTWDLERSNDGGVTWTAVRGATGGNAIAAGARPTGWLVYDYEAARGTTVQYRTRAVGIVSGSPVSNGYSATTSAVTTLTTWNLKCPEIPALNAVDVNVTNQPGEELTEDMGVFRALDRRYAVVVAGTLGGWDGDLTIVTLGDAAWQTVKSLLESQKILRLESLFGWSKYIRIVNGARVQLLGSSSAPRRVITVNYVETVAP